MKLYELTRGDWFSLKEPALVPPDAPEGSANDVFKYTHVDGMYAPVVNKAGERYYFAAWTEVEKV